MMPANVMVKTRESGDGYLHYEPDSKRYVVHASKEGACVFTQKKGAEFVQTVLPGGFVSWTLEALDITGAFVGEGTPAAARLRNSLNACK